VGTWNCIGAYSECPYIGYLLRNYVTDTAQQNPFCEAYSSLGSQEIPHILWNPRVQYHLQNSTPLVPIWIHSEPFHPTSLRSV